MGWGRGDGKSILGNKARIKVERYTKILENISNSNARMNCYFRIKKQLNDNNVNLQCCLSVLKHLLTSKYDQSKTNTILCQVVSYIYPWDLSTGQLVPVSVEHCL